MFDILKGVALVGAFLGDIAKGAMVIDWWDSTWRAAIKPIMANSAGLGLSP